MLRCSAAKIFVRRHIFCVVVSASAKPLAKREQAGRSGGIHDGVDCLVISSLTMTQPIFIIRAGLVPVG